MVFNFLSPSGNPGYFLEMFDLGQSHNHRGAIGLPAIKAGSGIVVCDNESTLTLKHPKSETEGTNVASQYGPRSNKHHIRYIDQSETQIRRSNISKKELTFLRTISLLKRNFPRFVLILNCSSESNVI